MQEFTRRGLLAALPAVAAIPALARAQRPPGSSGTLKITGFSFHKCSVRWRDLLFIEVRTDGGLTGLGEATCHNRVDEVEAVLRLMEPEMTGLDPALVEDQWDRIYYRGSRWRSGIILTAALSALDIAFWDLEGKRLGVPVSRLLGGPIGPNRKQRAYYTHWHAGLKTRTPEAFAERAAATVEKGWTSVKFSVPSGDEAGRIRETAAILAAMRKAVGERLDIGLEMFESFTPRSALRLAEAVREYRPMFLEEPIQRENPTAFGDLAAKSPVPIATGEGLLSRFEFRPLLDAKGAVIIQPDVVKCGGITEMRKIANLAEVYGVEVAPHMCYGPIAHVASMNAVSAARNFFIHEWEADDEALFREVSGGKYPVQQGGSVSLPAGPGLGLEVDFAELEKRFPYRRNSFSTRPS
jgi:galactonate dehydratase